MTRIRKRLPSPAMIVACIALVASLGGASYAAVALPKNSVGSKQLRKASVKPSKVAPSTVALFKGQTGSAGPKGDTGAKGEPGAQGETGPPGPFPGVLPSGKTVSGVYDAVGIAPAPAYPARDAISFGFALPAATAQTHFIPTGGANPNCPGTAADPGAAPGHLCVFEALGYNRQPLTFLLRKSGAVLLTSATAGGGSFGSSGSWAVTAP